MSEYCERLKGCTCQKENHAPKRIVITGGPGAGKTAVLEIARKKFCEHIAILPEAASILFSGGFWRHDTLAAKKAAQRAIFYIQRELEQLVENEGKVALALCDRGTLDSLAYWPDKEELFWEEVRTTKEIEMARYDVVIHLRTPSLDQGYNNQNPVRIETALEAAEIDKRIVAAWNDHPKRYIIDSEDDFLDKASKVMKIIMLELPECCKGHF